VEVEVEVEGGVEVEVLRQILVEGVPQLLVLVLVALSSSAWHWMLHK